MTLRGGPHAMSIPMSHRLPQSVEGAVQRVQMAARSAAERTVTCLGLAASASNNILQRDALLGGQYELNRKLAIFAMTFNESLDRDVAREVGTAPPSANAASQWDALSLVDDHEVEIQVSADRFALEIVHVCEWEIRELDAYMDSLFEVRRQGSQRNPLRPELVGQAMLRAVEAVADRPEVRKVLGQEIGRALAQAMKQTYADIVEDLRHSGIKPTGLTVRQSPSALKGAAPGAAPAGQAAAANDANLARSAAPAHGLTSSGRLAPSDPGAMPGAPRQRPHGLPGRYDAPTLGAVDVGLMDLIRRLAASGQGATAPAEGWSAHSGSDWDGALTGPGAGAPLANLIVAHREELRQAATGSLDHMVIDVVGSLFEQILADAKVAPQMARQIARLQLPVLRAALGDRSFFSSRKHPVRRFVNRIASLGCAWDDFDSPQAKAFLQRVRELVEEVVEGDFDQVALYEAKLDALAEFVDQQAHQELTEQGQADTLLAHKENQARAGQRLGQQLDSALQGLPVPGFLREFIGQTWSRAIATQEVGTQADAPTATRLRRAVRDLVMSVQPKGDLEQRKFFLRALPQLMKDLNLGLDSLQWPQAQRSSFFSQLLPAHAEALKGQALSTLDFNLLSRQVDLALSVPTVQAADLARIAVLQEALDINCFSAAEAQSIGLLDEKAIDWNGSLDIDLSAEPSLTAVDIRIDGLPEPEAAEPTLGKSLADHVQIGFAYQMHLEGAWKKVRLTHVSPGRSFFVFSHGQKSRRTLSMTYRMLSRMCETQRLRAFENAYLLERATARARRQLAGMRTGAAQAAPLAA